ncbi:VirB3 family type IV secretion system protein (plasmid) [Pseudomonas sp. R4-76]|uniref:VirB3 family type IV secretion system protein n=1 Tax=unclassified Pseudomonas TaxID=196821 RepID=UPI003DA816A6
MSDDKEKKLVFPSYNAMSRPAMWAGIPIMPLVGLFLGGVIAFIAMMTVFSLVWGIVAATPFAVALCALRIMTSIDDRYTRRVRYSIHRFWLNMKYGRQLLLTPYSPLWSQSYGKRISQQRFIPGTTQSSADGVSSSPAHADPDGGI